MMGQESGNDSVLAVDAESRFVALLKFDLVGSTRISQALSPSNELELRRAYESAVENLTRPNNVKLEWEGDGGLLVFGYYEVRVDAAEMAVRTALKLIEVVRSVNVVPSVRLEVRTGIASGPVTIDRARDKLSRVKPVSRAARLMEYAAPGQLLIAEDTRRLVEAFFEYEDLGVVDLDDAGRRRVWRVVRETAVVSRFAAQRRNELSPEIVGREEVLAQLSAAWSAASAGPGAAVCLVGDSGIGKSRLARAVLEWAERDAAVVLEIDCTPSTRNTPLLPVGVLLRRLAGIAAAASEDEKILAATSLLSRLLGDIEARESLKYLAPLFGIESGPTPLDKTREQLRAMTMAALIDIVRALAAPGPVAILCEDLHWADDTTAQFVQTLADVIAGTRVLLMVTRWSKPVTSIDLDAITAIFTMMPVDPLPARTAAYLVRAVAEGTLPAEEVDEVVGRCGGVPLLLEEVTRSIVEQADAVPSARASQPADSTVPPELQLVVESRLEQWPHLRSIVEAASVLGRDFPVPMLQAMVPGRGEEVPSALSQLAEHGLFTQPGSIGDERASFRHALIRDAVYETMVSKVYLRRLHSRAADTLISRYHGTPDASPEVLAQHLRMAERLEEAIRIRLAAGEDTFNRGAYVEAFGHCDAVRDLLDEIGEKATVRTDAFRWCVLRGMVETGLHGYSAESAVVAYREAHAMFDDLAGPESRYPVIRGLATASLVRGDLATAHRHALEGLELAERSRRSDYRIDATSVLAYSSLYFGQLAECRRWIERCFELYETEGGGRFRYPVPQDAKTAALALLPTAAWLMGDVAAAEDAIERGLRYAETLGRDFDKALLHAWTAGTRYTQRRYREALHHAGVAYALGKEHGFEEWEGVGGMMALISQSALAPAPEVVERALATAQAFHGKGVGLNASYFLWGIARGYVTGNNFEAARETLTAALQVASASQETRMNPEIWILQAELESDRSNALALLLKAWRLAGAQGAVANALRAALTIARDSPDRRHVDWARATLALLDGRSPYPHRPQWMHEELATASGILAALHPGCGVPDTPYSLGVLQGSDTSGSSAPPADDV